MDILNHSHEIFLTEDRIKEKVIELGERITADYHSSDLTAVCVLKGSFIFFADLVRYIKLPFSMDFIEVSSYGDSTESSGCVTIKTDITESAKNRDILIIEDIIDTGLTIKCLIEHLAVKEPISIKVCCLLDKKGARHEGYDLKIDYSGFEAPDRFLVGYGLDYNGRYRNLPYIASLIRI